MVPNHKMSPPTFMPMAALTRTTTTALYTSSSSSRSSESPQQLVQTIQTLAPTVILGAATAFLYSSVVRHPSSHLTRKSALYMLLLAFQVSIQPKLSQAFLRPQDDKVAVAFMEELVKTTLALILFFVFHPDSASRRLVLADWSLSSSLVMAAFPAALYALQGVLTYTSLQRLDAVTFNGLSQLKTASAAIWCFLLLGTTQSIQQMAAIAVLLVSAVIFQHSPATVTNNNEVKNNNQKRSASVTGITTCLAATFVSGLAGALSQRGVQLVGGRNGRGRDPFLFAGEVSFYSAVCLLFTLLQQQRRRQQQQQHQPALSEDHHLQRDQEQRLRVAPASWIIPVTVKAMGGIVTVLVHKYAGSVLKGFALVLGLVLSGMYEHNGLTPNQILGTVLVLFSSWLHFTSP